MAMEKSDCCLCGTALPVKTRKLLYGKAATGARTTLKRICDEEITCGTLEQLFPGAAKSESPQYICRGCEKLLLRISKEEDELGQLKKKVDTRLLAIANRQGIGSRKRQGVHSRISGETASSSSVQLPTVTAESSSADHARNPCNQSPEVG